MSKEHEAAEQAFHMHQVLRYLPGFTLDIDKLTLPRGYIMGLIGPNGAGKSTLIKTLLHLVHADFGTVNVLGLQQPQHDLQIKLRVGYVPDEPSFYDESTVEWTIQFVRSYYPTWDDTECRRLLAKWPIDPKRRIKELSRGTKVKLALVLALSHHPELLLLDEPSTGVDPVSRREVLEEMVHFVQDEGRSVLFSSHITEDVEQIADYVAIMHKGRIVEWDEKDALLHRWKRVSGNMPQGKGPIVPMPESDLRFYRQDGRRFTGLTDAYSNSWRTDLEQHGFRDIQVANVTLEDILIAHVAAGYPRAG